MFEVSSDGARKTVSPEDIGAAVIGELKKTAEMRLARYSVSDLFQCLMRFPSHPIVLI